MDAEAVSLIKTIVAIGATIGPIARWAVIRITKAIDAGSEAQLASAEKTSAAMLAASKEAAAAQLAAAREFARAQLEHAQAAQQHAVAFAELKGEIRGMSEFVHSIQHGQPDIHPATNPATGSGGYTWPRKR